MEQIIQQLTVTQKKNIIKNNNTLNELFKNKTNKALSKAKGEDIDNFINNLNVEERKIIIDLSSSELSTEEAKTRKNNKKDDVEVSHTPTDNGDSIEESDEDITKSESEKEEKEIPEDIVKKIFKDLYPTSIHRTKYIQENPSLKMSALTKGIFAKNAKKEDIDDFLVKQVPKSPKSMKQLTIDWLESKKSLKLDAKKLSSENLSLDEIRETLKEVNFDDFETYAFLMQAEISEKVFEFLEVLKEEEEKKLKESGTGDSEKVKSLETKIKELESRFSEVEDKHRDEINNLKQNYELEKEKVRSKYEQRIETSKVKFEEEKVQLVKIQADSDRRFAEERKTFGEQLEVIEKENKKLVDRINNIGSDLMNQNKQNKDKGKELTRTQNRIDDLQADNKELTTKNEELKSTNEQLSSQINQLRKQELAGQEKVKELVVKVQELEKTRFAFLLNESELQTVIKDLNAVDETKERMIQLLNIDTRQIKQEEQAQTLDDLWVTLIGQEEDIIADYLSIGIQEVAIKDTLKEKIDSLLDLEYNLKAREVLVKMLYEKGYKAYKNLQ